MQFTVLRPLAILVAIRATAAAPVDLSQSQGLPPREISSAIANLGVPTLATELPREVLSAHDVPTVVKGPLLVKEDPAAKRDASPGPTLVTVPTLVTESTS